MIEGLLALLWDQILKVRNYSRINHQIHERNVGKLQERSLLQLQEPILGNIRNMKITSMIRVIILPDVCFFTISFTFLYSGIEGDVVSCLYFSLISLFSLLFELNSCWFSFELVFEKVRQQPVDIIIKARKM